MSIRRLKSISKPTHISIVLTLISFREQTATIRMDNQNEIKALVTLLDDEDRDIFYMVRNRLIEYGHDVVPELEAAWEASFNPLIQQRIEDIVNQIQFDSIRSGLKNWVERGALDLMEGWLLLTRYQYPDMDEKKLLAQLERIRKDAWIEINDEQTALEKVKVLNHILFGIHGFTTNSTNYHAPGNNFINNLFESKKGNAASLTALYVILAQKLMIPVYGVNLPNHFILAYKDNSPTSLLFNLKDEERILFYVNPLNKGTVFSRREIDVFVKRLNLSYDASYYLPCSNAVILSVLLENLIKAFKEDGRKEKCEELEKLIEILAAE